MNWFLFVTLTLCVGSQSKHSTSMYVIFGRPGSGKTTIANEVVNEFNDECMAIDLDGCVPETFRENFAKGIYPTSQERIDFMDQACTYVENMLSGVSPLSKSSFSIISFSFVNKDLRQVFRCRFPSAHWILIDTPADIANQRISQREGHFYKVTTPGSSTDVSSSLQTNEIQAADSAKCGDWDFADIDFEYSKVDGTQDIVLSIQRIKTIILSKLRN